MKDGKKIEILAPAGSIEQLTAAVYNGCDSVYLGLDGFNARMKAPNFTCDNIVQMVNFCHLYGVKVYVTVNTSVKNSEFVSALKTLFAAYKANADGVIVTDLTLLHIAAQLKGNFEVVASTQLNCHDGYGARFLRQAGATTVVCARECSLNDIKDVASIGVNVETFVHGALCVCQSGQCLMSSVVGGNSGNRGLCAQPCRNYYSSQGESGYLLSTADLDGKDEFVDLVNAGANVFKIEGRNRSAEYAAVCSAAFSQLSLTGKLDKTISDDLTEVYKRGDMNYLPYLKCRNDGIVYPLHPKHMGRKVGIVKGNKAVCELPLCKGDGLKVFDKSGKEICGGVALGNGKVVECKFSRKVYDGMIVRRTSSVALSQKYLSVKKTLGVKFLFRAHVGEKATLTASYKQIEVTVTSQEKVEQALKTSTTKQEIVEQLQKTGNSYSTISDIVVDIDEIFLAKSQINALRRQALEQLQQAVIDEYNSKFAERLTVDCDKILSEISLIQSSDKKQLTPNTEIDLCRIAHKPKFAVEKPLLAVICYDKQQIDYASEYSDILVYKPQNIDQSSIEAIDKFVYLDLPSFADLSYVKTLLANRKIGVVCHNVGQVQLARDLGLPYILGRGMNIFNDLMLSQFPDRDGFVFSYELTKAEIGAFKAKDGLTFVDGQLPLMQLIHCPYKVALNSSCDKCKANAPLRYVDERKNEFFIVRRRDRICTFELLNGKRLSVCGKLLKPDKYLIDFDKGVIEHYALLNNGVDDGYRTDNITSGRLFNKIN